MNDRHCRYCQQAFQPDPYHPQQRVCGHPACQSQRRSDYHRQKIASDPVYQQVCLESPRKWRETHQDYWRKHRQDHPEQVERNRQQQQLRDQERLVRNLANNNLAISKPLILQPVGTLATTPLANNIPLVLFLPLAYKPAHAVKVVQVTRADSGTSEWSCRVPA